MTAVVWALLLLLLVRSIGAQKNSCFISESNNCSIGSLTGRTLVYPGGNTSCFYSNETFANPYAFQVDPGPENRVLFYLKGGGGCASTAECLKGDLLPPLTSTPLRNGIFNKQHRHNPFANWTLVLVLYCSGDYHLGQALVDGIINYQGRNNVLATWDWVKTNIPDPERVIVSGCSAGSIGMMYWSYPMLQYYSNRPPSSTNTILTALFDGYVGGAIAPVVLRAKQAIWKMCSSTDFGWTEPQLQACLQDQFSPNDSQRALQAYQRQQQKENHSAALFAFLSYKNDYPQRWSACNNEDQPSPAGCPITQAQHYALNQDMLLNNTQAADPAASNNVLSYWINGFGHCILHRNELYQVDNNRGQPTLVEFLQQIATRSVGMTLSSSCVPNRSWRRDYDYSCNAILTQAQFTQT